MEGHILIPVVKLINILEPRSKISQEEFNLRIWEVKVHFDEYSDILKENLHRYSSILNMIESVYDGLSQIHPKILSKKFEDLDLDDGLISFTRKPHR